MSTAAAWAVLLTMLAMMAALGWEFEYFFHQDATAPVLLGWAVFFASPDYDEPASPGA